VTPERRVVRVRTELAAVLKAFDYVVPAAWDHHIGFGTRVRVPLHGRSVRGWVVDAEVFAAGSERLLPLKAWLGWGPPETVVALADWAAWRWAGPASAFLTTASPTNLVRQLPTRPSVPAEPGSPGTVAPDEETPWTGSLGAGDAAIVRLPPATDQLDLVLSTLRHPGVRARDGSVLVLVPSAGWAERLTARLVRRGWPATTDWSEARAGWPVVVGNRAAAWAPMPRLAAAVVLDAHDEAYREESAPTYSAVDVVMERARREEAPCLLVSPVPPVELLGPSGPVVLTVPTTVERRGWPAVERVDRREADPRSGLFSEEFVRLARSVLDDTAGGDDGRLPLVCIYNRVGGARLLACAHCGELARCARCGAAAGKSDDDQLHCGRCGQDRPIVCARCGRLRMKTLRAGTSRLREELEALLGADVGEVSGPKRGAAEPDVPATPVLIGTEAVLHRVRRAAAVCFLDVDLHLLAPRLGAVEETLALLVRAGRLVGPRHEGSPRSRVQVQTRVPDHPTLVAAALGDPGSVLADEVAVRRAAGLPPFAALALLTGTLAAQYAEALAGEAAETGVAVVPTGAERVLLQAADHATLCDLLARVPRPAGRGLRVAVDPLDV
jgi:primosomal protein N' (replication factor Y)